MKPQELLGTAAIPGAEGELKLYRHDQDFYFRLQSVELMSSRVFGSEEILAELALAKVEDARKSRVLVCGLGMGFTLARVLAIVGEQAKVDVVELIPEVVTWNQEILGDLTGHPLKDPRVNVIVGDVAKHIRDSAKIYDAILLDVDNGPEGLTRKKNEWLYRLPGLHAARTALKFGGALSIWSSTSHDQFSERVEAAGLEVEEHRFRARRENGPRRTIWVAQRTGS